MLKKVINKTEYFYDIQEEISTTGRNHTRGLYIKIDFNDNKFIWIDGKGREITSNNWIDKLNKLIS